MIPIEFSVESEAAEKIRELGGAQLESSRSDLVREAMIQLLDEVIQANPVDTGKSRAAWAASLEELGGSPPAGWEGSNPIGIESGRQLGHVSMDEAEGLSQISAMNSVDYVPYLEYGTSKMSPFAMVRGGIRSVAGRLAGLFRW